MEPAELVHGPGAQVRSRACETASAVFFAVVFVLPLIAFLKNLVIDADWVSLNFDFFHIVFNSIWFTLVQASASALLACGLGVVLGAWLSMQWFELPALARGALVALGLFYFVLPGVVIASIAIELLKRMGLPEQGYFAVVGAHAIMNVLFIATAVAERTAQFRRGHGRNLLDIAEVFGASRTFKIRILFEQSWREQLKFFMPLVFLWSASSFATVIMLGGSPSRSTPEVLLFYSLQHDSSLVRVFLLFCVQAVLGFALYRLSLAKLSTAVNSATVGEHSTSAKTPRFKVFAVAMIVAIFAAPFARIATSFVGNTRWNPELARAALGSLSASAVAALAICGAWWCLGQSGSKWRKVYVMGCGLSTTMLATLWSQLKFDRWLEGQPYLQIVLLGFATAVAFMPLLALWLEVRIGSVPAEQIDAARLLGCNERQLARRVFLPQARDIRSKAAAFVALATLGELAFAGIFVFDFPLLSTLSKTLAQRYDFSGNQTILGIILLLCAALMLGDHISGRLQKRGANE